MGMTITYTHLNKDTLGYRYKASLIKVALAIQARLKLEDYELSVVFVDDEQIHEINRTYRQIDRPTDVISFALAYDSEVFEGEESELGEIYINLDATRRQAKAYGHSLHRELAFLFCHGLLHLCGYDHMTKEDEQVMFALQDEILDPLVSRTI